MKYALAALGLAATFVASTLEPVAADQRYEARIVANWTSTETFAFSRTSPNEQQNAKGTVTIKSSYSQNYQLSYDGGQVDFVKPLGPASSTVQANVTGDSSDQTQTGTLTWSETFGSSFQNPNIDKPATGTGSAHASNLDDWPAKRSGSRFSFHHQCDPQGTMHVQPGRPRVSHRRLPEQRCEQRRTEQQQRRADRAAGHDDSAVLRLTSGPVPPTMPGLAQLAPFGGGKARGSVNQGYAFDFSGKRDSAYGQGGKFTWQVSGTVRITILNKMKK